MKKFFANLIFILATLLAGAVIVPWNNVTQWGLPLTQMTTFELYIKGGIGALVFVLGLVFLIVSIHNQNNYGEVKRSVALVTIVPNFMIAIAYLGYTIALMWYMVFRVEFTYLTAAIFYGLAFVLLNIVFLAYFAARSYVKGSPIKKILLFLLSLEVLGGTGFAAYFLKNTTDTMYPGRYTSMYTYNYPLIIGVALFIYIIHLILVSAQLKKNTFEGDVEASVKKLREDEKVADRPVQKPSKSKKEGSVQKESGNKTMIVSKEQTIISGEENVDPTEILYEDVTVDPEFNKTANADKQVSSIEYYIEKPKMFKPLDPAFDQLVAHVRELPNVVTKLADERITFYVDRKPFLVLMNFGNYYRMAFRSELEKGIRLIIKYPTISKNKGTKDNL